MPFIWDDEEYSLVDKEKKYDKRRFVIARELFVKLNRGDNEQESIPRKRLKLNPFLRSYCNAYSAEVSEPEENDVKEFDEETLNEYFRKYGEIESIEMLKPKEQEAEETTESKAYAYVTFKCDSSAYSAVKDNDDRIEYRLKCEYNIQPADTWKQPATITARAQQQNSTVESTILDEEEGYVPPIFMLNEDCFEVLFKYLDVDSSMNLLEVCKKLNGFVLKHGFKHIKSFENGTNCTLARMRRTLKCIGQRITHLRFSSFNVKHRNPQRFFEILGKHVGNEIRHLDIVGLNKWNLAAIKPILVNLTSLKIRSYSDLDFGLFQTWCPNLTKLKVWSLRSSYKLAEYNNILWPKLKHLNINNQVFETDMIFSFLVKNPQITTLKVRPDHDYLVHVTQCSPNLQRITMRSDLGIGISNPVKVLQPLKTLKSLTKLSFKHVLNHDFIGILNFLKDLVSLRELKFVGNEYKYTSSPEMITQIQKSIIVLAHALSHLEKCCLSGIVLMESTVLDFIRFASNLKEIHIHRCGYDFYFTSTFILQVVEVLKSSRPQDVTEPLKLFIHKNEATDFDAIQRLDIKNYLRIYANCDYYYSHI